MIQDVKLTPYENINYTQINDNANTTVNHLRQTKKNRSNVIKINITNRNNDTTTVICMT